MFESFWSLNIKVDCRILNLTACFTEHIAKGVNGQEMYDYETRGRNHLSCLSLLPEVPLKHPELPEMP